jgi:hypothetical protein
MITCNRIPRALLNICKALRTYLPALGRIIFLIRQTPLPLAGRDFNPAYPWRVNQPSVPLLRLQGWRMLLPSFSSTLVFLSGKSFPTIRVLGFRIVKSGVRGEGEATFSPAARSSEGCYTRLTNGPKIVPRPMHKLSGTSLFLYSCWNLSL